MMQPNSIYPEHRVCRRFKVRERISIVLLPENITSERILDISENGIAFCYFSRGLENRINDKAVINITAPSQGLSSVSVRIISDCKIEAIDEEGLRRCGLAFVDLSKDQIIIIQEIIETLF